MKRWLLYLIVLGLIQLIPVERADVGKLRPVQAVVVCRQDGQVIIKTDTADYGIGETVLGALESLKETTPAVIYLDTAQYLIVAEDTLDAADELRKSLKDDVRVYKFKGKINPELAAQFLSAHEKGPRLKNWKIGDPLPILDCSEDRIKFLSNFKNSA